MQERSKMVYLINKELKRHYGKLAALTWKKLNNKKFVSKYNYISFKKKYYESIYQIFAKLFYKESVR